MKHFLTISLFIFSVLFYACNKKEGCTDPSSLNYDPDAQNDNGTCYYEGQVTFWQNSTAFGNTTVIIGGTFHEITLNYSTIPPCGSVGCATFNLAPGSYTYSASDGSYNWSGVINIESKKCTTVLLQ